MVACLDAREIQGEAPPGGVLIRNGQLVARIREPRLPGPGITLFAGVQLNRIGAGVGLGPTRFLGGARLTALGIFQIDGALVLALPSDATPFILTREENGNAFPASFYGRPYNRFTLALGADASLKVPLIVGSDQARERLLPLRGAGLRRIRRRHRRGLLRRPLAQWRRRRRVQRRQRPLQPQRPDPGLRRRRRLRRSDRVPVERRRRRLRHARARSSATSTSAAASSTTRSTSSSGPSTAAAGRASRTTTCSRRARPRPASRSPCTSPRASAARRRPELRRERGADPRRGARRHAVESPAGPGTTLTRGRAHHALRAAAPDRRRARRPQAWRLHDRRARRFAGDHQRLEGNRSTSGARDRERPRAWLAAHAGLRHPARGRSSR